MAKMDVDGSCQFSADSQPKSTWLDVKVGGHPALSLHSSDEPGELIAMTLVMTTAQ